MSRTTYASLHRLHVVVMPPSAVVMRLCIICSRGQTSITTLISTMNTILTVVLIGVLGAGMLWKQVVSGHSLRSSWTSVVCLAWLPSRFYIPRCRRDLRIPESVAQVRGLSIAHKLVEVLKIDASASACVEAEWCIARRAILRLKLFNIFVETRFVRYMAAGQL